MFAKVVLAAMAVSFAASATLISSKVHAQSEQDASAVMRVIATRWQQAISIGNWFVDHCANNTFSMERFNSDTAVSVDAQRSISVMSPFTGVIELNGALVDNADSPKADGFIVDYSQTHRPACFRNLADARAATSAEDTSPRSLGRVFTIRIEYAISPDGAKIAGGNQFFEAVLRDALALPENARTWGDVTSQPLPPRQTRR